MRKHSWPRALVAQGYSNNTTVGDLTLDFSKSEVLSAAGFLVAGIVGVWAKLASNIKRDQEDLKTCREDKEDLMREVRKIYGDFREMQGRVDTLEKTILTLSNSAVSRVAQENNNAPNGRVNE